MEFARQMTLRHCINGFIAAQRDMPRWGQLGCNGFIIFDKDLKVVSRKTSAYLQVKDRAFRDVEKILIGKARLFVY